jgi:hypothetical protein
MPNYTIVVSILIGVVPAVALGWVLWRLARRRFLVWWSQALVLVPIVASMFVLAVFLLGHSASAWRNGEWICEICGRVEERDEFLGIPIIRRAPQEQPWILEAAAYEAWFQERHALEHDHVWGRLGHHQGFAVSYSRITMECYPLLQALPELKDPSTVDHFLHRWIDARPEEREPMRLAVADWWEPELRFADIVGPPDSNPADERARFEAWLEANPIWR